MLPNDQRPLSFPISEPSQDWSFPGIRGRVWHDRGDGEDWHELVLVSLCYVLLPAFLVHIDSTFGTVVNADPGFFAADRASHDLLPPLSFFPDPEGIGPFPLSSRESVT
jgi:hypothetical protein